VVKSIKEDFNQNKSVYSELNQIIPKDAVVCHIADDFGQKDILLSLQQAKRKIFSWIRDEEKRNIAENNYLVQKRSVFYIKNPFEITKKADILLISDPAFDFDEIKENYPVIILFNIKNKNFENLNYTKEYGSEFVSIFRVKK